MLLLRDFLKKETILLEDLETICKALSIPLKPVSFVKKTFMGIVYYLPKQLKLAYHCVFMGGPYKTFEAHKFDTGNYLDIMNLT